jgi:CheY-like chemotaxis protein
MPTILCVDNDFNNRTLLEAVLTPRGYRTILADCGQDALEKAAAQLPDLILLDIMMPGMSGIEVLKKLRANEKTKAIPVVMITALSQDEDKARALEAGCDGFITKPFDRRELIARVEVFLKKNSLPSGAAFIRRDEINICPWCKKEIIGFAVRCKYCHKRLLPKEAEKALTAFAMLFRNWKRIVFKPEKFFKTMAKNYSLPGPLLFAMIAIVFGVIFGIAGTIATGHWKLYFLVSFFGSLVLMPIAIYVEAVLMQFFVQSFKGQGDYDISFKIVAYAQASRIFNIIPFIGGIVASVWGLIIVFIGIKELHKLDTNKSLFTVVFSALLIPLISLTILASSWLIK